MLFTILVWRVSGAEVFRVVVLEGDGAINNIRLQRAKEPVVRVETESGSPVQGAVVHFAAPSQGAGVVFSDGGPTATIVTDSEGRATGRGLRPNKTPGRFEIRVTASYQGLSATARIVQINAEPIELSKGSAKKIAILAIIGGAAAGGAAFAARGGGKSVAAAPPGTPPAGTVITPGTPILGAP
ncbi:MAG TPA: hypothetical protein VL285_19130 [Bryobacteraceae bacterium]|nr:hypothetical protein [Bryobacteraceae bacterium]